MLRPLISAWLAIMTLLKLTCKPAGKCCSVVSHFQPLLQALTSKLSLRRLSPSLSKKAPMKASLASLDGNDSDADDTATSDIPRETFGAKAQRSLRRSTSSFKIAAQKLTSVVRPTCLGELDVSAHTL